MARHLECCDGFFVQTSDSLVNVFVKAVIRTMLRIVFSKVSNSWWVILSCCNRGVFVHRHFWQQNFTCFWWFLPCWIWSTMMSDEQWKKTGLVGLFGGLSLAQMFFCFSLPAFLDVVNPQAADLDCSELWCHRFVKTKVYCTCMLMYIVSMELTKVLDTD